MRTLVLCMSLPLLLAGQQRSQVEGLVDVKRIPAVITVGGEGADLPGYNSRAIQLAIDALSARGGGTVQLGPGAYDIRGPIRLASHVTIEGEGADTVLRKSDGFRTNFVLDADYGMLKITVRDPSGFPIGSGLQLFDKERRNGYNVTTALVTAVDGNDLYIDSPTIQDYLSEADGVVSNAFPIVAAVEVTGIRIANLVIDGNRATNDYINGCRGGGVYLFRVRNAVVEGVHVRDFNGDSFSWQVTQDVVIRDCEASGGNGIGFHPGTGTDGTLVEDCVAHHNRTDGIYLCYRVQNGVFRRNELYANGRVGISIGHKDTDNLFEDNNVYENAQHGVRFRDNDAENAGHRNTFRKNRIENNGVELADSYGVYIGGATRETVLEDNILRSSNGRQRAAVFITKDAGEVTMQGNTIEGHPKLIRE